jgi:predicted O-methyltransferase YrrM
MNELSRSDVKLKRRTKTLAVVRQGLAVVPLLARLRRLNGEGAEQLVDIALQNPTIRPLQDRSEFLGLANIVAAQPPRTMLEIGTYRGGTLFVFARLAQPDATVISLDLPHSRLGVFSRRLQEPLFRRFIRGQQHLLLLRADSHAVETRSRVERSLDQPLDFLFVDGDHSYQGVRSDFEMYSPFVRRGGMVAFHDIAHIPTDFGVNRFWNEIKGGFKHREIINSRGTDRMGIGVLWM